MLGVHLMRHRPLGAHPQTATHHTHQERQLIAAPNPLERNLDCWEMRDDDQRAKAIAGVMLLLLLLPFLSLLVPLLLLSLLPLPVT
jgi:hypothetical protein